jgi:hypothetical protein
MIGPDTTSPTMKLLDLSLLIAAFVFNTVTLGLDLQYTATAVGGSLCGALVLAYLRRDPRRGEQAFKTLAGAVSGMVSGVAVETYFAVESPKVQLVIFFMSSLLSLAVLQGLLSLTEKNAGEIGRNLIQRLLGLQLPEERQVRDRSRRNRSRITTIPLNDEDSKEQDL